MTKFQSVQVMRQLMTGYYKKSKLARYTFNKVAWITSGAPVELLITMGIIPIYPENHGAMVGAKKMGVELSDVAEAKGYSRDLCSYFRVDVGQAITHKSPIGGIPLLAKAGLPKPDFLLCCNNICGTVLKWFEVQARYFNVPLIFLDAPYNFDGPLTHLIDYVSKQFYDIIPQIERASGRRWSDSKFRYVTELANEGIRLWREVLSTCEHKPAPMSCFDAFFFLAPIVTLRGTKEVVDFYNGMLKELKHFISCGVYAVENEKFRIVWDNIPIWYRVRKLSETLAKHGVCLVADTYTNAWADNDINPSDPFNSMARAYASIFLNRNINSKIDNYCNLIKKYSANGFIMHSNRSCKPYSFGQFDIKEAVTKKTGLPGLIIEADMVDHRAYSEEQIETRIQAFVETL